MPADGRIEIDTQINRNNVTRELRALKRELNNMANEMKLSNMKAMLPFQKKLIETQKDMFSLAQSMGNYTGTTKEFMNQVNQLGAQYKKASDNMINANKMIAASMIQQAGYMMNMSTQASKISANYDRMANPLYKVNKAGLAVADSLNKMANRGNAAVLALKMLGPNASMKQLYDMQMMINQGVMRFQMVSLAALATGVMVYGSLHKAAMEANKGYAESFNTMIATLQEAFKPLVDVFAMVMPYIYNFITTIGQMIIKFNEAHPVLSKLIAAVILLIPALTLILSPLAIGIGLWNGMLAAWNSIWMLIGPLITGLGAMSGTVLLVAGAVVGLVAILIYLWNTSEGFRNAVINGWNAIKSAAISVWGFIQPYIQMAIETVSAFLQEKLAQMKSFWDQHGAQIVQAVQNAWNIITTIFQTAMAILTPIFQVGWMILVSIVQSTWEAIKNVINGALSVIQGIIKVFSGLFTGDFSLLWEGIKQIFSGALQAIWGFVNLYFIGKFLGPLKSFGSQAKTLIKAAWSFIKGIFTNTLNAIKTLITTIFNAMKNTVNGSMNAIQSIIRNVWNSIKSVVSSVLNGIRAVVSSVWNAIKSLVTSAVNAIRSAVVSGFNALKSAVSSAMNNVKSAISSGWNKAVSFLKSINLKSIGKNIIQGLINGIKSMAGSVASAISNIAGNIKDRIMGALGIHSPSRWMRDMIGKNMMLGWQLGIEDEKTSTLKKVEEMLSWIMPDQLIANVSPYVAAPIAERAIVASEQSSKTSTIDYEKFGKAISKYLNFDFYLDGERITQSVNTHNAVNVAINKMS